MIEDMEIHPKTFFAPFGAKGDAVEFENFAFGRRRRKKQRKVLFLGSCAFLLISWRPKLLQMLLISSGKKNAQKYTCSRTRVKFPVKEKTSAFRAGSGLGACVFFAQVGGQNYSKCY